MGLQLVTSNSTSTLTRVPWHRLAVILAINHLSSRNYTDLAEVLLVGCTHYLLLNRHNSNSINSTLHLIITTLRLSSRPNLGENQRVFR
jgi:hypothetical protein